MTTINLEGSGSVQQNDSMTGRIKTYMNLSPHHLLAASRSVGRVRQIEKEYEFQPLGPFWEEILHNALGIATLTVASLECYANELYFENTIFPPTLNPIATTMAAPMVEKETVLFKFEFALALNSGKRLSHGEPSVQNVAALIKLRNSVLHFRPEWFDEQDKHDKLSRLLIHKFELSRFLPGEPVFPRAWASGSFAVWALESTVSFLDYFYAEAAILSPLDKLRKRLSEYAGTDILTSHAATDTL
ncbi:MAG: hypothetical protein ABI076_06925 [Acidobacteriaceae bacterium]